MPVLEKVADKLEQLSTRAEQSGGLVGGLAVRLAEDADFLRKVEPHRIAERLRGGDASPAAPREEHPVGARAGGARPRLLVVLAGALAAGFLLAKLIEWRSYAQPSR